MKLIMAIVSDEDSAGVSAALTEAGHSVTKLASTGGFLMSGNTTFLVGASEEKVDDIIRLIEAQSSRRTQLVPPAAPFDGGAYLSFPVEITVGGATIFVLSVDRFEKV